MSFVDDVSSLFWQSVFLIISFCVIWIWGGWLNDGTAPRIVAVFPGDITLGFYTGLAITAGLHWVIHFKLFLKRFNKHGLMLLFITTLCADLVFNNYEESINGNRTAEYGLVILIDLLAWASILAFIEKYRAKHDGEEYSWWVYWLPSLAIFRSLAFHKLPSGFDNAMIDFYMLFPIVIGWFFLGYYKGDKFHVFLLFLKIILFAALIYRVFIVFLAGVLQFAIKDSEKLYNDIVNPLGHYFGKDCSFGSGIFNVLIVVLALIISSLCFCCSKNFKLSFFSKDCN